MKAFIFARGGSKGIPMKNLAPFGSSNLLTHTIEQLLNIHRIDDIFVSTDCPKIIEVAESSNIHTVERPGNLASDDASELKAWLHMCNHLSLAADEPFLVAPVTSPLRSEVDFTNAFDLWDKGHFDIILSRTKSTRNPYLNMVTKSSSTKLQPLKYSKPIHRRQDAPVFWDVLTVLYLTTFSYISSTSNLMTGNVGWIDVPVERSVDIDSPFDLRLANLLYSAL